MKLPDFTFDNDFNTLRQAIGATLSVYKAKLNLPPPVLKKREVPPPLPRLSPIGIDISSDEIGTNPDGTLTYKGSRVTVHIRDVQEFRGTHHPPRFHVSNCRTLAEMRARGRFERYVVSDRDDGMFYIRIDSGPLRETRLSVCQNCLDKLSWGGFSKDHEQSIRHSAVSSFSLKSFFSRYPRTPISTLPSHTPETAPINDYPTNWEQISSEMRRQLRFTCQECGLQLGEGRKQYLHIHHVNGLKYDTNPDNLRCLCLQCHAAQPGHGHMRSLPEYASFMALTLP